MNKIDLAFDSGGFLMKFGLERIKALLRYAGNPQDELKVIHIAGTNGKGSTARFIYGILREHGFSAGLYTSPHLEEFSERIIVDEKRIKNRKIDELTLYFNQIARDGYEFNDLGKPSFFELTTAICFKYFYECKVDFAVIEAGLGGMLDATNVIVRPLLSVITNIGMDHAEILGNSLEKIAADKAGIIKKNSAVVCGEKRLSLRRLIEGIALKKGSRYFYAGGKVLRKKSELLDYFGIKRVWRDLSIPNKALYQKDNLKLALFSMEVLEMLYKRKLNIVLDEKSVRAGVLAFRNEGRFEALNRDGTDIVLDGAHNPDGIKKLIESLSAVYSGKTFIIIFSAMRDKDIGNMLKKLSSVGRIIFLTAMNNERACSPSELQGYLPKKSVFKNTATAVNPANAFSSALTIKTDNDVIVVCGSLYLIGEFKKAVLN